MKRKFLIGLSICVTLCMMCLLLGFLGQDTSEMYAFSENGEKEYIKWLDFNVSYTALCQAYKYDIDSNGAINWITLLAYAACKNGGSFAEKYNSDISNFAEKLKNGENIEEITKKMKYYSYYKEAYTAVLGSFVGEYWAEVDDTNEKDKKLEKRYGLKTFLPIAYGYGFSHFSDFGVSRSYGFQRRHEGNDLICSVGTPVVAVESGIVEEMGWNQYGGWRIGIRSHDSKRYYYYAHLRKDKPFVSNIDKGSIVNSGDVIGYVGMTGYSVKENVNGMGTPHLHFGIQLIFDESQKEATSQIWIDVYNIVKFLQKNPALIVKNENTGDFEKKYKEFSVKEENITS